MDALRRIMVHPIFNVRLTRRGNKLQLQFGRLRIEWWVVSAEWQDLCDEADAREREYRRGTFLRTSRYHQKPDVYATFGLKKRTNP